MENPVQRTLNPLVPLQGLFVGIVILYAADHVWAVVGAFSLLALTQWRLGVRLGSKQAVAVFAGAAIWALLTYINTPAPSAAAKDHLALWTFLRFALILWFSLLILRVMPLWAMLSHVEWLAKRVSGKRTMAGEISLIGLVAVRFLPNLVQSARRLRWDAQARRKLARTTPHWHDALRFLSPLIMTSILRSENVSEALWSRGWRPQVLPWPRPWRRLDWIVTAALWIALIIAWKEKI
ncbi:hypothetical protein BXT84_02575 [Sulfobacillus thermotolerans]|uniref:Cobalt transporter n=1 Tax=Sulfobacillus thermotolerans TaxID=338644 RepID=A0ABN5GXY1_9FIRM|nr:hypothetical protein BXT84_02575 [Sulfobacillus thermotolerans]